jgi:octaprenyl-diphosphate synthase
MSVLDNIQAPIHKEMAVFEDKFKSSMKSQVPLLDKITHYIIKRKGKQMRPMFVFLSAKMLGEINEKTYTGASLIELIHTATLVHDDVVDDANLRRGFFSINALWKNKIAVLVGDFLLSKSLMLSINNKHFDLLEIISRAIEQMSEGELLQIEKARRLDITEKVYYDIITKKTASLIASCCAAGCASVSNDATLVNKMWVLGEKIGVVFQIKDDLCDYETNTITGKPTGIDIKERKMTLPLIYALNQASSSEKRTIINYIKNHNENPEKVAKVIAFVKEKGGIEYTQKTMMTLKEEALVLLRELPENDARNSLEQLVEYTVNRKK